MENTIRITEIKEACFFTVETSAIKDDKPSHFVQLLIETDEDQPDDETQTFIHINSEDYLRLAGILQAAFNKLPPEERKSALDNQLEGYSIEWEK